MRSIEVDLDVFSMIWSCREPEEQSENDIIKRILHIHLDKLITMTSCSLESSRQKQAAKEVNSSNNSAATKMQKPIVQGKIRWVDDVEFALLQLGGKAPLQSIYKKVEQIRRSAGRSLPPTLEATVRRTIEDHSSDSDNFRGTDLFSKLGRGEWALRASKD